MEGIIISHGAWTEERSGAHWPSREARVVKLMSSLWASCKKPHGRDKFYDLSTVLRMEDKVRIPRSTCFLKVSCSYWWSLGNDFRNWIQAVYQPCSAYLKNVCRLSSPPITWEIDGILGADTRNNPLNGAHFIQRYGVSLAFLPNHINLTITSSIPKRLAPSVGRHIRHATKTTRSCQSLCQTMGLELILKTSK